MKFLNVVYWGWYQLLNKTVYLYDKSNGGFGLKEHAFFISFLLHGINLWTITRYVFIKYFNIPVDLYLSLFIMLIVFGLGYFTFLKNEINTLITNEITVVKGLSMIILTLIYSFITVYFMIEVGNYIRKELVYD